MQFEIMASVCCFTKILYILRVQSEKLASVLLNPLCPPPPPSGLVYNIRPVRLFPPFSFCEREEETIAAGRTRKREPREILYNKRERERERHVTYDKSDVG